MNFQNVEKEKEAGFKLTTSHLAMCCNSWAYRLEVSPVSCTIKYTVYMAINTSWTREESCFDQNVSLLIIWCSNLKHHLDLNLVPKKILSSPPSQSPTSYCFSGQLLSPSWLYEPFSWVECTCFSFLFKENGGRLFRSPGNKL